MPLLKSLKYFSDSNCYILDLNTSTLDLIKHRSIGGGGARRGRFLQKAFIYGPENWNRLPLFIGPLPKNVLWL